MYIVGGILLYVGIILPFLVLGYAIFLVRENKNLKYGAIYARAGIVLLVFVGLIGLYYVSPKFYRDNSSKMSRGDEEGVYLELNTQDTFTLRSNVLEIGRHYIPQHITGNYRFDNQMVNGLTGAYAPAGIDVYEGAYSYQLLSHFAPVPNTIPLLTFSYYQPRKSAVIAAQKKSRRTAAMPTSDYVNMSYKVNKRGDTRLL
jgi:hypothetical protein